MDKLKWKPVSFQKDLWRFLYFLKSNVKKKKKLKRLFNRASPVPSCLVNNTVGVYKGNIFKKLFITKFLVGYKLGEFSFTRKPFTYPIKIKKKNKR